MINKEEILQKLETAIKLIAISKINNTEKDKKLVSLYNKYRLKGGMKTLGDIVS